MFDNKLLDQLLVLLLESSDQIRLRLVVGFVALSLLICLVLGLLESLGLFICLVMQALEPVWGCSS